MVDLNYRTLLLPTAYLPPVSWYYFMLKFENVYIEQFETYPKQTYRNRCEIYTEKGLMSLSIPVRKVDGNHTITRDIHINNVETWHRNHWRSIVTAYQNSPYFLYYRDEFEMHFNESNQNLLEFNQQLIELIGVFIGVNKKLVFSEKYEHKPEAQIDLRFISPKNKWFEGELKPYIQVFSEKHGFIPNLSIIDLLFNLGPETKNYLENLELNPL